MRKSILQHLLAVVIGTAAFAAHAERMVIVNGLRLDPDQLAWLEQRNCSPVPNGRYWLDMRTGTWGYAGWPQAQGYIGAACSVSRSHPRSLSERGLLFRPGEIINGR